jgi:hypothetical protein
VKGKGGGGVSRESLQGARVGGAGGKGRQAMKKTAWTMWEQEKAKVNKVSSRELLHGKSG